MAKIVGYEISYKIIPFDLSIDKSPELGDIVFDDGHYYLVRNSAVWQRIDGRYQTAVSDHFVVWDWTE